MGCYGVMIDSDEELEMIGEAGGEEKMRKYSPFISFLETAESVPEIH